MSALLAGLRHFFAQVDWRLALMLGPRHRFSEAQWQRLAPLCVVSPTAKVAATIFLLSLVLLSALMLPQPLNRQLALGLLLTGPLLLFVGGTVWRRPTMRRLHLAYLCTGLPAGFLYGLLKGLAAEGVGVTPLQQEGLMLGVVLGSLALWGVAMWRNEFLADWLHDQDLREQSLELSQRLSSAQIQPHFLFNSLASLQHWVNSRDERAAPLLQSLTAYLRATLPLFDRRLLAVGEEAEAVRRYLEVMQARLGERLRYRLDIAPAAAQRQLPPGVLLTLVENAVEHGVQPQLGGGEVHLQAELAEDGSLRVLVQDDGPGLPAELAHTLAGPAGTPMQNADASLGLRSIRLRLSQAFGARASLSLGVAESLGGCRAELRVQPD